MPDTRVETQRLAFIDNLRWSAISMVVVMHAAVTYSSFGSWYVHERNSLSLGAKIAFATYQTFQHAVSMGLLFGIAGYFAENSLRRKGPARFLRERAYRLGLPLLLYMLVIGPVTQYFIAGNWHSNTPDSFASEWLAHIADGHVFSESGPLWFCFVLLILCALFAVIRPWLTQDGVARPVPGPAAVLAYAVAMAASAFAVGVLWPHARAVLNVEVHDLPQYPLMFTAGIMARRHGWAHRIPSRRGRSWLFAGLGIGAVAWFLLVTQGGALTGHLAEYEGGWHWQAAGKDLWRAFVCLSLSLGLVTLYRDRVNGHGTLSRSLGANAFGVYVFHAPILVAITRALHEWPADVALKFALSASAAIGLTFLFVGLVARRTPGLRTIL